MYIVFLVYNFFLKLILAHTHSLVATSVGVYLVYFYFYFYFYVIIYDCKLTHTHTHSLVATSVGVYLVAYQEAPAKHDGARGGGGGERGVEFEDLLELDDDLEALL